MKNKITQINALALVAGIASMGMLAPVAQAAPIVSFAFDTSGGFVSGTGTCSNGGNSCNLVLSQADGSTAVNDFQNVAWGTPHSSSTTGQKSNLQINHQSGDIATNGAWTTIDELVHTNNVLNESGGWMSGISIYGAVILTPGFPGPSFVADGTNPLSFVETLNAGSLGTCGQPVGGWPDGYTSPVCPDIYTTIPLDGIAQFYQDADYKYFVEFQFLAGDGAVVENVNETTVRIYTQEGNPGVSRVYTQARITAERIPEPGTLALMGLALVGLGAARYRKSR